MPDTSYNERTAQGTLVPIKAKDNGDGTFAPTVGRWAAVVTPVDQATVSAAFTDHVGSTLDSLNAANVSYNIKNVGANSITWQVLAANLVDFSDAVVVKAGAAVAAAATDTFTAAPAPYRFYKVQIEDTVNASHGTSHLAGIAKG